MKSVELLGLTAAGVSLPLGYSLVLVGLAALAVMVGLVRKVCR